MYQNLCGVCRDCNSYTLYENSGQETGFISGERHYKPHHRFNCSREQPLNADLYLVGINPEDNSIHEAKPCPLCSRMIIQAGIRNVYLRIGSGADEYKTVPADDLKWVVEEEA